MATNLQLACLRIYRQFRLDATPETALIRLREHLRWACVIATAAGRSTHAIELEGLVTVATGQLENVRIRADWGNRSGQFWRSGRYQGRLVFTLVPYYPNGTEGVWLNCETAGCAIKHAFGWMHENPQGHVIVAANRPMSPITIYPHTTMAQLLSHNWPED